MNKSVCVFVGEELALYGFGHGHPFGSDRMQAFWDEAVRLGLDKRVQICAPALATQEQIERFHSHEYVERVKFQSQTGQGFLDYGDTPAFPGVYEAAAYVVGTSVAAMVRVLSGECRRAFVPIAGLHHARRDGAAGFCVFNDCGVVIETLRVVHGIRRVAYVDIDAHHGDGVFYAFEDDPEMFFADLHEDGRYLYPGTGAAHEHGRGAAAGTKLNIPMRPGADDQDFRAAWPRVESFLRAARPEFIILQCGADSLAGDPITHLQYSAESHRYATTRLCEIAEEQCSGRLLALGGGGYNRANLAAAWTAVVEAMLACPGE
ncbi:MAG TPA: acetoin utilization protein AcuC [Gammaproteobacteria bacterium]|nr:acetoin utilization protein AcuC [Gammaproteobacteria bacterium]